MYFKSATIELKVRVEQEAATESALAGIDREIMDENSEHLFYSVFCRTADEVRRVLALL